VLSSKTVGSTIPENFKLHDLLRDVGYRVHFILSGKHEWFGLREFYGEDVDTYFDGTRATRFAATDDRVLLEGLETVPPADSQPAFLHFHLMSTHQIGVRQEQYEVFTPSLPHGRPDAELSARVNSYDNAVRQADGIIQQLFEQLQRKGYLNDALVMIVADHGESLGAPGEAAIGHGPSLRGEALNIPWLIVDSAPAAYRNLEFGAQVDVAPTIVTRLGLPVPASWEGRSLLLPLDGRFSFHYTNFAGRSTFAVVQARGPSLWKLVQSRDGEELFDLVADPREQRNVLPTTDEAIVDSLRTGLASRIAASIPAG
jgi:predicted AlkP superfamily pyrophosphatase or phosphodiesterase